MPIRCVWLDGCRSPEWGRYTLHVVWSVGVELLFYLVAPFLLTRLRVLATVTAASLLGKLVFLVMAGTGLAELPCGFSLMGSIVPLELGVFGLGALAYRFYAAQLRPREAAWQGAAYYVCGVAGIMLSLLLVRAIFTQPGFAMLPGYYAYLFMLVAAMPFLFAISHARSGDRQAGELSYAFYLIHLPVLKWAEMTGIGQLPSLFITLALSLAGAWAVARFVEKPLTAWRHRRFR